MTETRKRQAITELFRVADYARIAHHIRGRIRIKFPLAAKKGLADIALESLAGQLPGVQHYRINGKNGSLVIDYDPAVIPCQMWERIINSAPEGRPALAEELLSIWTHSLEGEQA
ncbi:HMA2 domain-containing protein [Desulfuromonas thiophila]|uniref:Cation transporter n=1 Tax=Desulfuromonas thiophila TaxID=57664 RepID=A0A1G6X2K0_9BACT|nr:hypothetical protein [Desulfuromonas thiophila]SDD71505.1 hypothetical protein SAMN05661003_10194 [Desulfuromonas thiophila]